MIARHFRGMLSGFGSIAAETLTTSGAATIGGALTSTGAFSSTSSNNLTNVTVNEGTTPVLLDTGIAEQNPVSPAEIAANQTAYLFGLTAAQALRHTRYILTTDAAGRVINTIAAPASGYRQSLWIINGNTDALRTFTLLHDDGATGTAADRIRCPGNVNLLLTVGTMVNLWYNTVAARWQVS